MQMDYFKKYVYSFLFFLCVFLFYASFVYSSFLFFCPLSVLFFFSSSSFFKGEEGSMG